MTIDVRSSIESSEFELGQVLGGVGTKARIDLTQVVSTDGSVVPNFWVSNSHDQEAFEAGVRGDPRVAGLRQVDRVSDSTLYEIRWAVDCDEFLRLAHDHEVLIEDGVGTHSTWYFVLRLQDREALSRFHDACRDRGVPLSIDYVDDTPDALGEPRYGMTDKQYEAVMLAFQSGYFRVPREATQSELSDELDITSQSLGRRLSRGLCSLIGHTMDASSLIRRIGNREESPRRAGRD